MFLALTQDLHCGSVLPLPQFQNNAMLVNDGQFFLMSNVCPHQQSRIAKCSTSNLKCPYHGFEFDLQGQGINNSMSLTRQPCYITQTMLFDQRVECSFPIDTSFMKLYEHRVDFVKASADIVMDVFLDIDHIPVAHQGVYDQVGISSIDQLSWKTFNGGSIQYVPAQDDSHIINSDKGYNLGACWLAIYPGTMIEWQPGALFVTVAVDVPNGSNIYVYKYFDSRYSKQSQELNDKVWELAWSQDKDLSENIVELEMKNIHGLKKHHREWIHR